MLPSPLSLAERSSWGQGSPRDGAWLGRGMWSVGEARGVDGVKKVLGQSSLLGRELEGQEGTITQ